MLRKHVLSWVLVLIMCVEMLPITSALAITEYDKIEVAPRTIVYDLNGGTGTPPVDNNAYTTEPYKATILDITDGDVTPPAGKQFTGWSPIPVIVANEWYAPGKEIIVSENGMVLYAIWMDVKESYTVTFRTKTSDVEIPSQTVNHGGKIVEPDAALMQHEGYTFEGWYEDSSLRFPWDFDQDVVVKDMMLHAKWSKDDVIPWTVTYHMSPEVIGPGPESTYQPNGGNVRVQNIPEGTYYPGKVFAGWSISPARVLELKYREGNNVSDYVAVKYEGVHLYDVWVDEDPSYSNSVNVDFSKEYQTMAGIGDALCFNRASGFLQIYNKYQEAGVPDEENPILRNMELSFDDESGAKMEIFRMIIGDGGIISPDINPATGEKYEWGNRYYDGPSDSIWPEPGIENIVWNQPDWEEKKDDFDYNQIWCVKKAMEVNPDLLVYGAAWTPPYWMKTNMGVRNDVPYDANTRNNKTTYPLLDDAYYEDWARYLVEWAWGMYAWFGIPIYSVCPTNETEIDHGYSGYVFRGDDYERFLLDYLKPMLEQYIADGKFSSTPSGAGTGQTAVAPVPKIAAPESTRMDRSTSALDMATPDSPGYGEMMSKPEIQDFVDVFNTHMYEHDQFLYEPRVASDEDPVYPEFMNQYPEIWMTEIGQQFPAYNDQNVADNLSMVNGLSWARRISNQFASEPGFTGYILWFGTASSGVTNESSRWINLLNAGSSQSSVPSLTGQYRIFKRYYSVAQFSRFIKQGYIRIGADRVPFKGANVTAYKSSDGKDFAIVMLNEDKVDHTITLTLNGNNATSIVPYRTSDIENMRMLSAIEADHGVFTVTLPAMSITTFVNDKGDDNLPGMNYRDVFTDIIVDNNDGQSGTVAVDNGIEVMNNGYIRFNNFNFADGTGVPSRNAHVLRLIAHGKGLGEGELQVRIDNESGKLVGVFKITESNDLTDYYAQIDTGDLGAYGFKDFVVVYKGTGSVYLEKFTYDSTLEEDPENLVANSTFNTNDVNNWEGKGAIIANTNTLYYRTRSLSVSTGGNGVGAEGELTALPVPGETYKVNAFFFPAFDIKYGKDNSCASGLVNGGKAEIRLQYYRDTELVASQVIASRDDVNNIDWRQVTNTFVYNPPSVDFTNVKLLLSMSEEKPYYVDEVTFTKTLISSIDN